MTGQGEALTIDVNGQTLTYVPRRGPDWHLVAAVVAASLAVAIVVVPRIGFADWIAEAQKFMIDNFFADAAANSFHLAVSQVGDAVNSPTGVFTAGFDSILGDDTAPGVYTFIKNLSNLTIKPVAATLFGLVMMTEFIKISQRADMHQTLPLFKEVMTFMVFVVLYMALIRNGFDVMGAAYSVIHRIDVTAAQHVNTANWDVTKIHDAIVNSTPPATIGSVLVFMALSLVAAALVFGARIKVMVAGWMLGIQIYIQAAFAPLAFVFLAYEGTKQWALGYIRHFFALALNGVILMIIFYMFAIIVSHVVDLSSPEFVYSNWDPVAFIKLFGCLFMLSKAVGESDKWASQVFGG